MPVSDKKRAQLVNDIQGVLNPGEDVVDITTAFAEVMRMGQKSSRKATIAVTDRRVIIFSKKLGGYDVQDFAFGLLSSVDHKRGMMYGNIDLRAAGDGIKLTMIEKDEVERVAQSIRDQVAVTRSASAAPAPAAASPSAADEIRSLAALRDDGLISAEDFEAKKKQILGL